MSLLLDALKKAADDRQKASHAAAAEVEVVNSGAHYEKKNQAGPAAENPLIKQQLSLEARQPLPDIQANDVLAGDEHGQDDELTLQLDELDELDELAADSDGQAGSDTDNDAEAVQKSLKNDLHSQAFTISDDALAMLVNKTNRDVKRSRKLIYGSVFIGGIMVIAATGIYYYLDMKAQIAMLERKHQIEMLSIKSKTGGDTMPEKSAVIRSLVSDVALDEKVKEVKSIAQTKATSKNSSAENKAAGSRPVKKAAVPVGSLSVSRSSKVDPVAEKLEAAWLFYENADYQQAKRLYKDILNDETKNRDALLGLGAIAVIEKDDSNAREIYLDLLKLDPRDPIATAALAGMHNDAASLAGDEQYMLAQQQKNPESPQLNFALANIYAQQNRWKSAQQFYFNAWQADSENADYSYNLAVSLDQLDKQQQALAFYRDSLQKSANKQVSFSRQAVEKRINELSGQ